MTSRTALSDNKSAFSLALLVLTTVISFLTTIPAFAAGSSGITYHGRVLKPDGTPLESQSVQFRLQIRTPGTENCLMYEEVRTVNMKSTSGVFELSMNDGTGARADSTGLQLDRVLANRGSFNFTAATCDSGTGSYIPNEADGRRIQVYFRDENMTTWEPLPSQAINFAPLAIEAKQIGGFNARSLLRVEDGTGPQNITSLTPSQFAELNVLSLGTSTNYLKSTANGAQAPVRSGNPAAPAAGQFWFDTATSQLKYYDGSTVQVAGGAPSLPPLSSGQIFVGNALNTAAAVSASGDATISNTGAISLKAVGTASTYVKVTTDAQGRVVSGSTTLAETDLPATITTAGRVSGSAITSGTIAGTTLINTTGAITGGAITGSSVWGDSLSGRSLLVYEPTNTRKITITAPAVTADYALKLPAAAPSASQMLVSDASGNLTWSGVSAASQWTSNAGNISYSAGNVGIGTTTPVSALDITGKLSFSGNAGGSLSGSASGTVNLESAGAGLYLRYANGDRLTINNDIMLSAPNNLVFANGGTEAMRVVGGKLGIGTVSPTQMLDVNGSIKADNIFPTLVMTDPTNVDVMKWSKIATVTINARYDYASLYIDLASGFGWDPNTGGGQLYFKVKQQSLFPTPPFTELYVVNAFGQFHSSDVKAVVNASAAIATVDLYLRPQAEWNPFGVTPRSLVKGGTANVSFFASQPYYSSLPSGSQISAVEGTFLSTGGIDGYGGATPSLAYTSGNVGIGTSAPLVTLDLSSRKDAIALPKGNATTERPAAPTAGMFRYNTVTNSLEFYNASTWQSLSAGGSAGSVSNVSAISNSSGGIAISASGGNAVQVTNGASSLSSTSGAFVVTGGVGISENLNVGQNLTTNGAISAVVATAATGSNNFSSPSIFLSANYWNGATAVDKFSITNVLGAGTNPTATLTFDHPSGTSGAKSYSFLSGNVGIGTTSPTAPLHVSSTSTATSGAVRGIINAVTFSPSTTSTGSAWAGVNVVVPAGTADVSGTQFYGAYNQVYNNNSNAAGVADAKGTFNHVQHGTSAVMQTATGSAALVENLSTGTINGAYGVTAGINNTGGGTIIDAYGVYITSIAGTNRWGLYQTDATAKNFFAGNVGIGTTTPGAALDVTGGIRAGAATTVTATCNAATEGIQRYNYSTHFMEYCDGTAWSQIVKQVAGAATPVTASGPPVGASVYTVSSATANYTPGFGSSANTISGNWPAVGSAGGSNPNCVELKTLGSDAIVYDLGSTKTVGHLYVSALGQPYGFMLPQISFSLDNVTYNSSVTATLSNNQSIQFTAVLLGPAVSARYLRLTNGGSAAQSGSNNMNMTFCQLAVGP